MLEPQVHTQVLPFKDTPFPLGRHVEHDPRSRRFAFAPTTELPLVSKTWRRFGNVLDQGNLGACTGFAMAHCLNSSPLYKVGSGPHRNQKGVDLYSRATSLDEFPGQWPTEDTGSSGNGVCKAAREAGHISEWRWGFGFEHTLQLLMHGPVLIGTWWFDNMFFPDTNGLIRPVGNRAGGHEYLLIGVRLSSRILIFQNSWSYLWGLRGRFYMTFDDFRPLLADDGDAVLPMK